MHVLAGPEIGEVAPKHHIGQTEQPQLTSTYIDGMEMLLCYGIACSWSRPIFLIVSWGYSHDFYRDSSHADLAQRH